MSARKLGRLVSLRALDLSDSVVTDESLQMLPRGLRLLHLRGLSRITNDGVDSIIDLCTALEVRSVLYIPTILPLGFCLIPCTAYTFQELDISRCVKISNSGLERMCNRLHLWVPRLHTLNVHGCPLIDEEVLHRIVARRPPRGSVVLGKDGTSIFRRREASGRPASGTGGPSDASGPEVDVSAMSSPFSGLGRPGRHPTSVPVASSPKLASEAQWFQLSPTKHAAAAISYDGTKALTKTKHAAIERGPAWEPTSLPLPRKDLYTVGEAGVALGRWGQGSDGVKGSHHRHWAADSDSWKKWFEWCKLGEPPTRSPLDKEALDDVEATTKAELPDDVMMTFLMGCQSPTPALHSCVDAHMPFAGFTWSAHEVEALMRSRYKQHPLGAAASLVLVLLLTVLTVLVLSRSLTNEAKELSIAVRVQRMFRSWSQWNATNKRMLADQARLGKGVVLMQAAFRGFKCRCVFCCLYCNR
jgi:hypothetical protein